MIKGLSYEGPFMLLDCVIFNYVLDFLNLSVATLIDKNSDFLEIKLRKFKIVLKLHL